MAEAIYNLTATGDTDIAAVSYVYNSATGKAEVAEGLELNFPLVIWWVLKTTGPQGEDIWVSDYVMANRDIFRNYDIFKYEYDQSEIFHAIERSSLDLDDELYSEDFARAFN